MWLCGVGSWCVTRKGYGKFWRKVEVVFSGMEEVLVVQIMKGVESVVDALGRKQKL